jgi:hypothetical protein
MENFQALGKVFIIIGILIVVVGIFMSYSAKIPFIGRLPGDILVQKKNFTLFFPLTSLVILNILIYFLIMLFRKQ